MTREELEMRLKGLGMSKSMLADKLDLNRQTLDKYLDLLLEGKEIPKEKYRIALGNIIKPIIDGKEVDVDIFNKEISYFNNLITRDKKLGISDWNILNTDRIFVIFKKIRDLMPVQDGLSKEEVDERNSLFSLIEILIEYTTRAKEVKWIIWLSKYFELLNKDKINFNDLTDEEKDFSVKVWYLLSGQNKDKLTMAQIEKFTARIEELKKQRKAKSDLQENADEIKNLLETAKLSDSLKNALKSVIKEKL